MVGHGATLARDGSLHRAAMVTEKTSTTHNSTQEVASVARQQDVSRSAALRDRIEQELATPLRALGLDIEAVELTAAGKRSVLRIAVDGDAGVTLDDIANAAKQVSETLDASDVMGQQAYTLEVTSRGVDRPLTLPRHWRRNVDRLVKVTTADGETVTGRITGSGEDTATLDVDGTQHEVVLADVAKALVQVEFNRKTSTTEGED
jgi:ribosome maturation factor RimP